MFFDRNRLKPLSIRSSSATTATVSERDAVPLLSINRSVWKTVLSVCASRRNCSNRRPRTCRRQRACLSAPASLINERFSQTAKIIVAALRSLAGPAAAFVGIAGNRFPIVGALAPDALADPNLDLLRILYLACLHATPDRTDRYE
jgi:hypothetical protein